MSLVPNTVVVKLTPDMLKIPCEFKKINKDYYCVVSSQEILESKKIGKFIGDHTLTEESTYGDCSVRGIKFKDCNIPRIPMGLKYQFKIFTSMSQLILNNCKLKRVDHDDFYGFFKLQKLDLGHNEIESLPGDLFYYMKDLKWISFAHNKIKSIAPNLLDDLNNLETADFTNNPGINWLKKKNDPHFKNIFTNKCRKLYIEMTNDLREDLNSIINDDSTKDFVIRVDGVEFKVHKFLFAARSKTIKDLIANNPNENTLELNDISASAFKKIHDFIYTDKPPNDDADAVMLFEYATKLKIIKLREVMAQKLIESVNDDNKMDFLFLANKLSHEGLKDKAFHELIIKTRLCSLYTSEFKDQPEEVKEFVRIRHELFDQWRQLGVYDIMRRNEIATQKHLLKSFKK